MEHTREALLIRFGDESSTTASRHWSGGPVKNPGRRRAPLCKNCKTALQRILELDLSCPELDLDAQELNHAIVLTCLNCDAYAEPLRYRELGGNKGIQTLCQGKGESFGDFPEQLPIRGVDLSPLDLRDPSQDERLHQVGGEPFWLDDEILPKCTRCRAQMRFLAQIDSDPRLDWNFGDAGMLYAFFCAPCHEFASIVQGN